MENKNKAPREPQNDNPRRMRQPRRGFNWFSLVYLFLLLGLAYMWSSTGTSDPMTRVTRRAASRLSSMEPG